jgi:hypothetical protein
LFVRSPRLAASRWAGFLPARAEILAQKRLILQIQFALACAPSLLPFFRVKQEEKTKIFFPPISFLWAKFANQF